MDRRVIVLLSVSLDLATEWTTPTDHVSSVESINIHDSLDRPQHELDDQMTIRRVLHMRSLMPQICHGEQ